MQVTGVMRRMPTDRLREMGRIQISVTLPGTVRVEQAAAGSPMEPPAVVEAVVVLHHRSASPVMVRVDSCPRATIMRVQIRRLRVAEQWVRVVAVAAAAARTKIRPGRVVMVAMASSQYC